ncbi:MAG: hypothetical protein R3B45_18005 [Bdellovibrionota bacterium]
MNKYLLYPCRKDKPDDDSAFIAAQKFCREKGFEYARDVTPNDFNGGKQRVLEERGSWQVDGHHHVGTLICVDGVDFSLDYTR